MPTGPTPTTVAAALPGAWRFVGRRSEREEVRRALLDPAAGGLLIRGPAGVGKTSLVAEIVHGAGAFPGALLELRGLRARRDVPFDCLARALPDLLADAESGAAALLARAVALIDQAGVDAIWVDDAADIDEPSALVLHFLATERRLPIVLTARTGQTLPEPVVALRVSGTIGLLTLGPLTDAEVAELVEEAMEGQVDTPTVRRFVLLSEGSPLHLRELVRAVAERGALRTDGGVRHWEPSAGEAWALGGLVAERLERLSPAAFRACGLVALADGLPRPVLVGLIGPEAVAEAEHAEVIVAADGGTAVVMHPVHRDVMVDGLSPAERTSLCRVLARSFSEGCPAPDPLRAIAFQMEAGDQVDHHLLAEAADECRRRSQPLVAERLYRRLVELDPAEGHLGLGGALLDLGRDREAHGSYCAAASVAATADQAARAAIGLQRAARWLPEASGGDVAGSAGAVGHDLADVSPTLVAALQIEQAVDHALHLRIDAAMELLSSLRLDASWGSDLRRRAGDAWTMVALATGRCDDLVRQLEVLSVERRLRVLELQGDGAALARYVTELRSSPTPGDLGGGQASLVVEARALADLFTGDGRSAARGFREIAAAEERREGVRLRRLVAWRRLAEAEARSGNAAAALEAADAVGQLSPSGSLASAQARLAGLWAALASADRPAAIAVGQDLCGELASLGCFGPAAEAGWLAWRLSGGTRVPEQLLAALGQVQGPLWTVVSRHVQAEQRGDAGGVLDAASGFADLGRWIEASEAAAGAAARFADLGDRRQGVAAARAAEAFRARRPEALALWPDPVVELPALSEREEEVVALVALGLSNRAIAERLILSVRTVEGHVLRSSAKLGVTSRAELAQVRPLGSPRDDDVADGGAIG